MKKFLLLVFMMFSLATMSSKAEITTINGEAKAFPRRLVRVSTYSDMITNRIELLSTALIGKDGKFSMQIDLKDTISCIISVGFRKAVIYLVPGSQYFCKITANADSIQQQRLPAIVQELPMVLVNLPGNDINFQILKFNKAMDKFLEVNASILKPGNKKTVLDSLSAFRKQFNNKAGSFADTYIFYKLADIESMVNRWDDKAIYTRFIKNRPVLYSNPAYMDYFNIFYEHFLTSKSKNITSEDLDLAINKNIDLAGLTDIAGKDSLLRNERIRELVMLKNLGELYYSTSFQSQNVLTLIQKIEEKSKYPEHQLIANNLYFQITQLNKGSKAPEFSFIDQQKKERMLTDFRGKWVYLSFFMTWCEPCISEMKVIPSLKQQFGSKLEFISVCCNENLLDLGYFLNSNKNFDWNFFNLEDDMGIVENYRVMTYPFYVLIDPEGNIFQYPVKSPEDHLKDILETLLK